MKARVNLTNDEIVTHYFNGTTNPDVVVDLFKHALEPWVYWYRKTTSGSTVNELDSSPFSADIRKITDVIKAILSKRDVAAKLSETQTAGGATTHAVWRCAFRAAKKYNLVAWVPYNAIQSLQAHQSTQKTVGDNLLMATMASDRLDNIYPTRTYYSFQSCVAVAGGALDVATRALIDSVLSFMSPIMRPFPHQIAFLQFMFDPTFQHQRADTGGILGDDMGLGKTLQILLGAIAVCLNNKGTAKAVIHTMSAAISSVFLTELVKMFSVAKDTSNPTVYILKSADTTTLKVHVSPHAEPTKYWQGMVTNSDWDIAIVSVSLLEAAYGFITAEATLFMDEGDLLRGGGATANLALRTSAKKVWLATGTIVNNTKKELNMLLSIVKRATTADGEKRSTAAMRDELGNIMLRRTMSDVDPDTFQPFLNKRTPAVVEIPIHLQLCPTAEDESRDALNSDHTKKDWHTSIQRWSVTGKLKLNDTMTDKLIAMLTICRYVRDKNETIIIPSHSSFANVVMHRTLINHGVRALIYPTAGADLQHQAVAALKANEITVLILRLSAGRGLNLQFCQNMLLIVGTHNPVQINQARARIVRIGSPHKEVTVFTVYYKDTYDSYIWETTMQRKMLLARNMTTKGDSYATAYVKFADFAPQQTRMRVRRSRWLPGLCLPEAVSARSYFQEAMTPSERPDLRLFCDIEDAKQLILSISQIIDTGIDMVLAHVHPDNVPTTRVNVKCIRNKISDATIEDLFGDAPEAVVLAARTEIARELIAAGAGYADIEAACNRVVFTQFGEPDRERSLSRMILKETTRVVRDVIIGASAATPVDAVAEDAPSEIMTPGVSIDIRYNLPPPVTLPILAEAAATPTKLPVYVNAAASAHEPLKHDADLWLLYNQAEWFNWFEILCNPGKIVPCGLLVVPIQPYPDILAATDVYNKAYAAINESPGKPAADYIVNKFDRQFVRIPFAYGNVAEPTDVRCDRVMAALNKLQATLLLEDRTRYCNCTEFSKEVVWGVTSYHDNINTWTRKFTWRDTLLVAVAETTKDSRHSTAIDVCYDLLRSAPITLDMIEWCVDAMYHGSGNVRVISALTDKGTIATCTNRYIRKHNSAIIGDDKDALRSPARMKQKLTDARAWVETSGTPDVASRYQQWLNAKCMLDNGKIEPTRCYIGQLDNGRWLYALVSPPGAHPREMHASESDATQFSALYNKWMAASDPAHPPVHIAPIPPWEHPDIQTVCNIMPLKMSQQKGDDDYALRRELVLWLLAHTHSTDDE